MKRHRRVTEQAGQSLVEIIVVVGTVVLMVSGLIVATTSALKTTRFSTTKSPSVKYAQEGIEQARKIRDSSWSSFFAYKDSPDGLWCLNAANAWSSAQGSATNCAGNLSTVFTRTVQFSWDAPNNRMQVQSVVTWNDGGVIRQSDVTTYFTDWR